jgi:hypothetical protein
MCAAALCSAMGKLLRTCQQAACSHRCRTSTVLTPRRHLLWPQHRSGGPETRDRTAAHGMPIMGQLQQAAAFHGHGRHRLLVSGSSSAHTACTAQRTGCQWPWASSAHSSTFPPAQAVRCRSATFGSSSCVSGLRAAHSRSVAVSAAPAGSRRGLGMAAPFVYERRDRSESEDDEPVRGSCNAWHIVMRSPSAQARMLSHRSRFPCAALMGSSLRRPLQGMSDTGVLLQPCCLSAAPCSTMAVRSCMPADKRSPALPATLQDVELLDDEPDTVIRTRHGRPSKKAGKREGACYTTQYACSYICKVHGTWPANLPAGCGVLCRLTDDPGTLLASLCPLAEWPVSNTRSQ